MVWRYFFTTIIPERHTRLSRPGWRNGHHSGTETGWCGKLLGRCLDSVPRQPGGITSCDSLPQHIPPFIWIFQKVQGHCYRNLGVSFGLAFENTDISRKNNEVASDLHDSVSVHVTSPC
jgi:hypothetical protein